MLKDMNIQIRILVIEIIIKHEKLFEEERLSHEFLPLLIKEINSTTEFLNNWMLDNFPDLINFFLSHPKFQIDANLNSLHAFLQVFLRN